MNQFLRYYSWLYLVELLDRTKKAEAFTRYSLKRSFSPDQFKLSLSRKEGWVVNEIAVKP